MPMSRRTQRKVVKEAIASSAGEAEAVRSTIQNHPEPPEDPSRAEWMKLGADSPALGFWNRPEEDIYSPDDGEPI